MANVIVIGAGLGGLTTAMLLALDGHDVTVLERDPEPPPAAPGDAWDGWSRRGVSQFRLPHVMLPRWRALADDELPDLVPRVEALGGRRWHALGELPEELTAGPRPGDERFVGVAARRPVLEAAAAAAAAATYGVTVQRGAAVAGLRRGDEGREGVPHVTGVATSDGDALPADLVVDTSGRRSRIAEWLEGIGARRPVEQREDSGFVYYARHFRAAPGARPPTPRAGALMPYDSLSVLVLPQDDDTWSVTFICSGRDRELRALRDPQRWHATAAQYPLVAPWLEGEPITGVDVIAGIEDRHRRLAVDGDPVATGIVAVGDSWAATNPSLGRGASMALLHARCLRDLLREVPVQEADKFARRFDEVTETTMVPLYQATRAFDRHRLAEIEAQVGQRPYETEDPAWAITTAFGLAARRDPDVLRHYYDVVGFLAMPDEVIARPGVLERVIELGVAPDADAFAPPGPDRAALVEIVRGS